MNWSFLSGKKIADFIKKFFYSDKSKIKSLFLLLIALIPALFVIWIWWWGANYEFKGDYPLRSLSARWLATVITILVVVSWVGIATWLRVKKLEGLKLECRISHCRSCP